MENKNNDHNKNGRYEAVKMYKHRRAARLGIATVCNYDSVQAYRMRRAERLSSRADADDDDAAPHSTSNGQGGKKKGHGNTKLPFGLCQREGIKVQPGWTPQDAWAALEGKGYSAKESYKELQRKGAVGKRTAGETQKDFAGLSKEYTEMLQRWKEEDQTREEREIEASKKSRKFSKLQKVQKDYRGESLAEAREKLNEYTKKFYDDGDESARADFYKYRAMVDVMETFGEDSLRKEGRAEAIGKKIEAELADAREPINHRERNEARDQILARMAESARVKYKNFTDCDSPMALEARIRGDDFYEMGDFTRSMMDYSSINPDMSADMGTALQRMKERFPKLKGKVKPPILVDADPNVYAQVSFGDQIEISRQVFEGDHESAVASIKRDVKSGFHPQGCASVGAMITHEYGHIIDHLISQKFGGELSGRKLCVHIMDTLTERHKGQTSMDIMKQVSTYSWRNSNPQLYSEFVAEAFSEYVCSKKPRPVAVEVGRIIESYINRLDD